MPDLSNQPHVFPARKLAWVTVASITVAVALLTLRCITDHCYLYLHGPRVLFPTVLLAGWFFVFFAGKWVLRIGLLGLTGIALALLPTYEGNIAAAASSSAAAALRHTAEELEEYSTRAATFPATIASPTDTAFPLKRFYHFEYVPIRSAGNGPIDAFLLKARPVRCDCLSKTSFLLSSDGNFHVTQENRDAMLSDPVLQ